MHSAAVGYVYSPIVWIPMKRRLCGHSASFMRGYQLIYVVLVKLIRRFWVL